MNKQAWLQSKQAIILSLFLLLLGFALPHAAIAETVVEVPTLADETTIEATAPPTAPLEGKTDAINPEPIVGAPTESITGGSPEAPKPVPENGNPVNVDGPLVASDANTSATTPLDVPMMPMAEATPFERLQQAIAAAAKDGTPTEVTVAGDIAFTEGLLIDDNRNIIMRNAPGETARLHWAEGTSLNQSMITIMPGAALIAAGERNDALVFDGEGKASKVKGKAVFIENKGDLTIEKASFINAGNTSYNLVAPIRAIGADANITMNGGVIADNHFHSTTNSNSSWYTAGGILLDGGAHMVMNGGEIRGNKAKYLQLPKLFKQPLGEFSQCRGHHG